MTTIWKYLVKMLLETITHLILNTGKSLFIVKTHYLCKPMQLFEEAELFARCSLLFASFSLLFARGLLLFARCSLIFARSSLLFACCSLLFAQLLWTIARLLVTHVTLIYLVYKFFIFSSLMLFKEIRTSKISSCCFCVSCKSRELRGKRSSRFLCLISVVKSSSDLLRTITS